MEIEIRETRRLTRYRIGPFLLANHDRRAPQEVTRSDDALLREDEHRARALNLLIHQIDALHEGAPHIDEQRHELRLVDGVGRVLTEVHPSVQQFLGYLLHVVDLRYRRYGIAAQMRVDDDGLRICIADDTDALVA